MWIGSPSHRCSAITYSDERSLNWLGPGMARSHAPASGCATPMSREHSRSATFTPPRSPTSPSAPVISSSHEPSWVVGDGDRRPPAPRRPGPQSLAMFHN